MADGHFPSPVAVAANTVYVASYFAPVGHYSYDPAYFATSGVDEAPIHALANGVSGGNGVYVYGSTSRFPSSSFNSTNYWVDVVFATTATDTTPPGVTGQTPAPNAAAVAVSAAPTATFSEPVQSSTISFVLKDAAGTPCRRRSPTTPPAKPRPSRRPRRLATSTTYTATVSGAKDLAGNAMSAPVTWSFTTAASVANGPYSVWTDPTVPGTAAANDSNAVELGMKFRTDVGGTVTAIRFYKGSTNTGTHVGHLWAADGTLLATATFANETASGWQSVTLSQPVTLTANTTYVVSYYAPVGRYAADGGYFASAVRQQRAAARPGGRRGRRQRSVPIRDRRRVPEQQLQLDQLLGGRRLQSGHGIRHHPADPEWADPGA